MLEGENKGKVGCEERVRGKCFTVETPENAINMVDTHRMNKEMSATREKGSKRDREGGSREDETRPTFHFLERRQRKFGLGFRSKHS